MMTHIIFLLLTLVGTAAALTEAEAAKWTTHIKNNMFRGVAATPVDSGAHRRSAPRPVYLDRSWWEGDYAEFDERDYNGETKQTREVAGRAEAALDPCFWANDDACDIPELREEALITEPANAALDAMSPLLADLLARPEAQIPCVTTDDGCSVEAAAGVVTGGSDAHALEAMWKREAAVLEDPCFWEEGCHAFA